MRSLAATVLAILLGLAACRAGPRQPAPAPYPDTRPEQLTDWTLIPGGRMWWLGGLTAETDDVKGGWVRTEWPLTPDAPAVGPLEPGRATWTFYYWTEADCTAGALRLGKRVTYRDGLLVLSPRVVGPRWVQPSEFSWQVLLRSICESAPPPRD